MPEFVTPAQAYSPADIRTEAPLVAARGITLSRDGQRLLRGVDLCLNNASLTVVMGPNGAGKSLLLRVLHGMLEPDSGELLWNGQPLDQAGRLRQAMVFQKPVMLRRSVEANIRFALKLRGLEKRKPVEAILRQVGLAEHARQPARLLSGGEQQRLCLARALALEPEVLFLDEPTASLDPASTALIEEIVRQAHSSGTKIVFVTHDLGQARRLADDVLFLAHGAVAEHTLAERFFQQPQSQAARDYLAGRLVLEPGPPTDRNSKDQPGDNQ